MTKKAKWDFSEWNLPEIESDSISILLKKAVASAIECIFKDDSFYKCNYLETRHKRKKGLFWRLSFDPATGEDCIEHVFNLNECIDEKIENYDDVALDLFGRDELEELSLEFKKAAAKIDSFLDKNKK